LADYFAPLPSLTPGQATILEPAIEWTRAQMDTLVDLIDELEDEMEED
jgi:hypothetical protein